MITEYKVDGIVARRDSDILTVTFTITYHGKFKAHERAVPSLPRRLQACRKSKLCRELTLLIWRRRQYQGATCSMRVSVDSSYHHGEGVHLKEEFGRCRLDPRRQLSIQLLNGILVQP